MGSSRDLPMRISPPLRGWLIPLGNFASFQNGPMLLRQQAKIREIYDKCKQECFSWMRIVHCSREIQGCSVHITFSAGKKSHVTRMSELVLYMHGVGSWSGPGVAKPFASKAALCCLAFKGSFPRGNSLCCSIQS